MRAKIKYKYYLGMLKASINNTTTYHILKKTSTNKTELHEMVNCKLKSLYPMHKAKDFLSLSRWIRQIKDLPQREVAIFKNRKTIITIVKRPIKQK